MERLKVCESEYRLCLFVWENEPITRKELVRLCKERLDWSRLTVCRVINRLADRGILKLDGSTVTSLVKNENVSRFDAGEIRPKRVWGWLGTCPVAFGEIGVKQRVVNSLTYKKPAFWVIILAVIIAVVLVVLFLTGPSGDDVSGNESSVNESAAVDTSDGSSDSSEQSRSEDSSTDNSEPQLSSVAVSFVQYIFDGGEFEEKESGNDLLADEFIVTDKNKLDTLVSKCDSAETFEDFDGNINDYAKTLPEDFFDNNAIIAVPVSSPAQITYFRIDKITRFSDNRVMITVQRDEGLDTAMQYNLLVAEVSKSDIEGCTEFLVSDETAELIWYSGKVSAQSGSGDAEKVIEITDAEAKKIRRILNSGDWTENTAESTGTHDLTVGERKLSYNSVGGIIVDTERGYTLTLSADEKTVFDSALEEKEEENEEQTENETVTANGKQKTHQTPENLNFEQYEHDVQFSKVDPIYFKLADVDKMFERRGDSGYVSGNATTEDLIAKAIIQEKGNKLWICTERGEKIDYVYSNSEGIFRFDCPAGTYTFFLDSDVYEDRLVGPFTFDGYSNPYQYPYIELMHIIPTYHDVYDNFKVQVVDSATKQPLKNVKVTVDDIVTVTDGDGFVTYKPLLYYVRNRGSVFEVKCELGGYVPSRVSAHLYETYRLIELERSETFDFSITVFDMHTGKPLSGATVFACYNMDPNTYVNNTVTGEDGVISGRCTTVDLKEGLGIEIRYTETYTDTNGKEAKRTTGVWVRVTKDELDVYVDFQSDEYSISLTQRLNR